MFNFGTMGKRVLLIVFAVVFASILLFGGISIFTLLETERNYSRASLETVLSQMMTDMEQDYQFLLHLSQHMSASGPIGIIVSEYLRASDMYEQGVAKRKLAKALSTYAGLDSELVMYVNEQGNEPVFYNFPPEAQRYKEKNDIVIYQNYLLSYHAIHPSYNRYTMRPVISLSRRVEFEDDTSYEIYIEQATRVPRVVSSAKDVAYVFLQLDTQGTVRYSSDVQRFPIGATPELPVDTFGQYASFYFARSDLVFGASCVLLAPQSAYEHSTRPWLERSLFAVLMVLLMVFAASTLLYRYVFSGLHIFSKEIDKTSHGDLTSTAQKTGIDELDALLQHFDAMKAHIQAIMRETAEQEQAQKRREFELLVYQINPHFLLNTLNSLHWLAAMNHQGTIARYISSLSAILSYSLGRAKERPTLRSELVMLRLYLEIEQCRHNFQVTLDVQEGEYLDLPTPRLLMQPIVENAIGHGMDDGGNLSIAIAPDTQRGQILVVIEDDGCGIPQDTLKNLTGDEPSATGVGLRYVHTMLQTTYGAAATMGIESKLGGGTRVTLALPLKQQEEKEETDGSGRDCR